MKFKSKEKKYCEKYSPYNIVKSGVSDAIEGVSKKSACSL